MQINGATITAWHVIEGAVYAGSILVVGFYTNTLPTAAPMAMGGFLLGVRVGVTRQQFLDLITSLTQGQIGSAPKNPVPPIVPAKVAISYQIQDQPIVVAVNNSIGATEMIKLAGGSTIQMSVGSQTTQPFILKSNDSVPVGAFYLGKGQFELNGNYFGDSEDYVSS